MATNVIFEPVGTLSLPVPDGTISGQVLALFGGKLPAVALTDEGEGGNADNFATCAISPAWVVELAVKGENGAGNSAVAVGDTIVIDTDAEINKDTTNGTAIGLALATVGSGLTATIRVLILPAKAA